jgi:hypothetical protein
MPEIVHIKAGDELYIEITPGTTYGPCPIEIIDSNANNAPVDLTTKVFRWTAKEKDDDPDAEAWRVDWNELSTPLEGKTNWMIPAQTTATYPPGVRRRWVLKMHDTTNPAAVIELFKGSVATLYPVTLRTT